MKKAVFNRAIRANMDTVIAMSIFLAGLLYYLAYYNYGLNILDEGYLLDAVMRVRAGETPYRDFQFFYAPGRLYLFSLIFELVGPSLTAVRLFWVALHLATGVLMYLSLRRLAPVHVAAGFAALTVFAPGVWHKSFIVFFPTLTACLVFRYIDRPGRHTALAVGFAAGVACFFRQDVGVYPVVGFLAMVALTWSGSNRKRELISELAWLLAGLSVVVVPFFAAFAAQGALKDMLWDLGVGGYLGNESNSLPFPPLFPLWDGDITHTLVNKSFYLPFAAYVAGAAYLMINFRGRSENPYWKKLFFIEAAGLMLLMQLKSRSDVSHLWQVMPPVNMVMAALIAALYVQARATLSTTVRILAVGLFAAMLAWLVVVSLASPATGSIAIKGGASRLLKEDRARVYVNPGLAANLEDTLGFIRANMGDAPYAFVSVPDAPLFYFLSGRRNPVRYGLLRAGMSSREEEQRGAIRDLDEKKVGWVIFNKAEVTDGIPSRAFASHSNVLNAYILKNYRPVRTFGRFVVMRRVSEY